MSLYDLFFERLVFGLGSILEITKSGISIRNDSEIEEINPPKSKTPLIVSSVCNSTH